MALAFIDTKTGGLDVNTSLLELAIVVTGRDLSNIASFSMCVKPDDGIYHLHPNALRVNKINPVIHDTSAVSYSEAAVHLTSFLESHYVAGAELIPAGWNVAFDMKFIRYYFPTLDWNKYFTYRNLDGASVLRYLQLIGKMPNHLGSLSSCIKYLRLAQDQDHSALADCNMTIAVMQEFFNVQ